jgi:hypothetical protein
MSGENVVVYGTAKTLEASGASIANNAVVQANDATYDVAVDGGGFPDAEFYLTCAFTTAPTENTTIALYARPLDIDGTNDAEVPEAGRPTIPIGTFTVNDVTTTQYILLNNVYAMDLPAKADYYLYNNGTGQSVSAGWKLVIKPRTRKAAP